MLLIVGASLSSFLILGGALAKLEHWPIASLLLTSGLLSFSFLFLIGGVLLVWYFSNSKTIHLNGLVKAGIITTSIGLACRMIGALAKLEHWPIASMQVIVGDALSVIGLILIIIGSIIIARSK